MVDGRCICWGLVFWGSDGSVHPVGIGQGRHWAGNLDVSRYTPWAGSHEDSQRLMANDVVGDTL